MALTRKEIAIAKTADDYRSGRSHWGYLDAQGKQHL
jgi:hypothetical protein